jgi:hypothetical protein
MAENTRDLMDFPLSALKQASRLLAAYRDPERDLTERLGEIVTPEFNGSSGFTFLIDRDFHCAMIDPVSDELRDWFLCAACYCEGFREHLESQGSVCCQAYLAQELAKLKAA